LQAAQIYSKLIIRKLLGKLKNLSPGEETQREKYNSFFNELQLQLDKTFSGLVSTKKELEDLFNFQYSIERLINIKCTEYYNGKHPKHHLWTGHYQFIIDNVNEGDKVFDVGTGASLSYTQELAKKCSKIDCCDIRDELVKKAEEQNAFKNVHYRVLDITKELPQEKYDVVIMSHILEHLENPEDVLKRAKSISLKIIVRLPRYDDHWMYLVKKDLGLFYYKDGDHKKEYTLKEAIELVESSGWKIQTALNDIDIKILAVL
jgi:hypothetical protein